MIENNFQTPKTLYLVKNGIFTIIIDDPTDKRRQQETILHHKTQLIQNSSAARYKFDYKNYSRQRYWQLNKLCDIMQLKFQVQKIQIGQYCVLKPSAALDSGISTVELITNQCHMSSQKWINFVLLDIKLINQISISERDSSLEKSSNQHDSSSEKGSNQSIYLDQSIVQQQKQQCQIGLIPKNQNSGLQLSCEQCSGIANKLLELGQAIKSGNFLSNHDQNLDSGLLKHEALNQSVQKQGLYAQEQEELSLLQNIKQNRNKNQKFDQAPTKSLGQKNNSVVNQQAVNKVKKIQENLIQQINEVENFFDGDSEEEILDEPQVSPLFELHQFLFDQNDMTASRDKTKKN